MCKPFIEALLLAALFGSTLQADHIGPAAPPLPPEPKKPALAKTKTDRGLCLVVGAEDATQLADLTNQGWVLVQGLTINADVATRIRSDLVKDGVNGLVTIQQAASYAALPYNANMVNLLVADLDALGVQAPAEREILRVLAPGRGAAWLRKGGQWRATIKHLPAEMDDWTHFNHGPDNNPVSKDTLVGPMVGVQWTVNVEGGKNNNVGILLGGGKFFSNRTCDWDSYDMQRGEYLEARDAFNGMLLWRRGPGNTQRTNHEAAVVTDGKRLYGYLSEDGVARAVDFESGTESAVYREAATRSGKQAGVMPFMHAVADGLLVQLYGNRVTAISLGTEQVAWSYMQEKGTATVATGVSILNGRAYLAFAEASRPMFGYGHAHYATNLIVCLDLKTGRELWRNSDYPGRSANFVAYKDLVVFEENSEEGGRTLLKAMVALDASTGKLARRAAFDKPVRAAAPELHGTFGIIDDMYEPMLGGKIATFNVLTGERGRDSNAIRANWCGYTRWTPRIVLPHASGYVDRSSNEFFASIISRSACDFGRVPGYGQVYTIGAYCACAPVVRGPTAQNCLPADYTPVPEAQRPERGEGKASAAPAAWPAKDEWPMFLGNNRRNPVTDTSLPDRLELLRTVKPRIPAPGSPIGIEWANDVSVVGPTSAPTLADRLLFVAITNAHRLDAFDATSGELRWSYTAGGRIDGPPTVYGGLAIFGCRDGCVYALESKTGKLAWRYMAAPARRSIVVSSQLESLWPVFGSVMIVEGRLVVTAGRVSEADGGIRLVVLDPLTGALLAQNNVGVALSSDPTQEKRPIGIHDWRVMGNDILSSDGKLVYMTRAAIHPATAHWVKDFRDGSYGAGGRLTPFPSAVTDIGPDYASYHLHSPKYGMYRRVVAGDINAKKGDGWVYGLTTSYGGDVPGAILAHRILIRGKQLFALTGLGGPMSRFVLDDRDRITMREVPGKRGGTRLEKVVDIQGKDKMLEVATWFACAGERLLVGGWGDWKAGNLVRTFDLDGKPVQEIKLPAKPVVNGVAIAYGSIYVTLEDGSIAILGAR